MSVTAKVTFVYRYKQAGYTFSLYNVCPSLESLADPKTGKGPVDNLQKAFMQLLGTTVESPYVRVSDEALRGDSLFFDRNYITIGPETTPQQTAINVVQVKVIIDDFPDFYDTGALVIFAASTTQKGRMTLRFIPDSIINYPIGLNPDRNWDNGFRKFAAQLVADKWCVKCLADANTEKPFQIQTVTRTAAGTNLLVTTFATHGYAAQNVVRLSKVQGLPNINGIYTIDTVPTGTTFTLANTKGDQLAGWTLGNVRRRIIQYPAITSAGYRYVTRRKAGRPFGAPVGRRKKVKTSQ